MVCAALGLVGGRPPTQPQGQQPRVPCPRRPSRAGRDTHSSQKLPVIWQVSETPVYTTNTLIQLRGQRTHPRTSPSLGVGCSHAFG